MSGGKADQAEEQPDALLEELSNYAAKPQPRRLGGWLVAVAVYLGFLGLAMLLQSLGRIRDIAFSGLYLPDLLFNGNISLKLRVTLVADCIYTAGGMLFVSLAWCWLNVKLLDRSLKFPRYCSRILLISGLWISVGSLGLTWLDPSFYRADRPVAFSIVFVFIPALLLHFYIKRSQRVRETFLRP